MKKNIHIIGIFIILMVLLFLSKQPIQDLKGDKENILYAIDHTLNSNSYTYSGKIFLKSLEAESSYFAVKGKRGKYSHDSEITLEINDDIKNISLCHYYEDQDYQYIMTPFKPYEKMQFDREEMLSYSNNELNQLLEQLSIEVIKNQPIMINQGSYDEVNIMADCYHIEVDFKKLLNQEAFSQQIIDAIMAEYKVSTLSFNIYVDEAYYIRSIKGQCLINNENLIFEIHFNNFEVELDIETPDTRESTVIKKPFRIWLSEQLMTNYKTQYEFQKN